MLLKDSSVISRFSVLDQGCTANALSSAMSANNPSVLLLQTIAAASVRRTAQLAEMKSRLDQLPPSTTSPNSDQPAKITITGKSGDTISASITLTIGWG